MLKKLQDFFSALYASSSVDESFINQLFNWFLILSVIIYLIVLIGTLVGAIKYWWKKRPEEPEQISGKKWIEVTWTVIPFLILVLFFYFMVIIMKRIEQPYASGQKPDIVVVAHQWWWEMRYPEYKFTTANELHIPAKKRLLMRIESADVIHSWWVPALGRKIDAIPGKVNYTWIEALDPGEYKGTCSEYCGAQHAWMRILVLAQPQQEFDNWIAAQQIVPPAPQDSLKSTGMKLFIEKTCIRCHSIAGTPGSPRPG
jgi:cytochrome c oxidase subunit 2